MNIKIFVMICISSILVNQSQNINICSSHLRNLNDLPKDLGPIGIKNCESIPTAPKTIASRSLQNYSDYNNLSRENDAENKNNEYDLRIKNKAEAKETFHEDNAIKRTKEIISTMHDYFSNQNSRNFTKLVNKLNSLLPITESKKNDKKSTEAEHIKKTKSNNQKFEINSENVELHLLIEGILKILQSANNFYVRKHDISKVLNSNIRRILQDTTTDNMYDVCIGVQVPKDSVPKRVEVATFLNKFIATLDAYLKHVQDFLASIKTYFNVIHGYRYDCEKKHCLEVIEELKADFKKFILDYQELEKSFDPEPMFHQVNELQCKPYQFLHLSWTKL